MTQDPQPLPPEGIESLVSLFRDAFDEIHTAILLRLSLGTKPPRKSRFPQMSVQENGMPTFTESGYWSDTAPREFSEILYPPSSEQPFGRGERFPADKFPAVDALASWILATPTVRGHYGPPAVRDDFARVMVEVQLAGAIDRYFLRFGEEPVTPQRRSAILAPLLRGMTAARLKLALVVPVALTHFEFDHFRLAPDAFMIRMTEPLQLARWSGKAYGGGAHNSVVGAATHAFVNTGWSADNAPLFELSNSLSWPHVAAIDLADRFLAALRVATGVETGYAQQLLVARRWVHSYAANLPNVFASGMRRYPHAFDNFGWTRENLPTVTREQMVRAAELFSKLRQQTDGRFLLALKRLNAASIRDDVADAVLDATIALEILLGDGDTQAISYKLRMRAAALARLAGGFEANPRQINSAIKTVYEARSRIVHGGRPKRKRKGVSSSDDDRVRGKAMELLRGVLEALLEHPRYLDPSYIDDELLIGAVDLRGQAPNTD